MNSNSIVSGIKCILIGMALGSIATVAIASKCNLSKNIAKAVENVSDNMQTMFKIN